MLKNSRFILSQAKAYPDEEVDGEETILDPEGTLAAAQPQMIRPADLFAPGIRAGVCRGVAQLLVGACARQRPVNCKFPTVHQTKFPKFMWTFHPLSSRYSQKYPSLESSVHLGN